jgi:hypothetical protein
VRFRVFIELLVNLLLFRWVYKRLFVADGNFKADHIRQKNKSEVWLSEGGGMMSKTEDYEHFLASAVERRTVSILFLLISVMNGFSV